MVTPADRAHSILNGIEARASKAVPPPWVGPDGTPVEHLRGLHRRWDGETVEFIGRARTDVPNLARAIRTAVVALEVLGRSSHLAADALACVVAALEGPAPVAPPAPAPIPVPTEEAPAP